MTTRSASLQSVHLATLALLLALAFPVSAQNRSASDATAGPGAGMPNMENMGMGGMGAMPMGVPTIPKVNLTESTARQALDAFIEIRNNYETMKMPKPSAMGATASGMLASQEIASIVGKFGFSDTKSWYETVTNVALAYGFLEDGDKLAEFDKSMTDMKDANIPPEMLQQLMASVDSMRPSESNVAVVKALLADPVYRRKLEDFHAN